MGIFQSALVHHLTAQLYTSGKQIPFIRLCFLNSLRDMELFVLQFAVRLRVNPR